MEPNEFTALVPVFEACFVERMRDDTSAGLPRLNRRSTPYQHAPLPTIEDKLLVLLVHMQQNLTQEVHGQLFGMIQSDANTWLQLLRPSLLRTLERLDVVPARRATCLAAPEQPATADHTPFGILLAPNVPSNDP